MTTIGHGVPWTVHYSLYEELVDITATWFADGQLVQQSQRRM